MRYAYAVLLAVLVGGGVWAIVESESAKKVPPRLMTDPAVAVDDVSIAQNAISDRRADSQTPFIKTASAAPQAEVRSDNYLQTRLDAMHQRRHGKLYRPETVAAAVSRDTAWTTTDEASKSLPLKPEEFTDGREFIKFDPLKIESLMPGDTFTVALEKGGTMYRVQIDTVELHDGGRISWHGHLAGLSGHYSVSFTRGESLTVGGLDTPKGHYVLQAHGANGWIATSELLFKRNPDQTDAIVPPSDGHTH